MSPSALLSYSKFFTGSAANNQTDAKTVNMVAVVVRGNRYPAHASVHLITYLVTQFTWNDSTYAFCLMVCARWALTLTSRCVCRRVGRMCPYVVCHLSRTNFTTIEIVSKAICPISLGGRFVVLALLCHIFSFGIHSTVGFHNFCIRIEWVNFYALVGFGKRLTHTQSQQVHWYLLCSSQNGRLNMCTAWLTGKGTEVGENATFALI